MVFIAAWLAVFSPLAVEYGPSADLDLSAPTPVAPPASTPSQSFEFSRSIIGAARYYLSHAPLGHPENCTGYLEAVYERAGVSLQGGPDDLWARGQSLGALHHRAHPEPGDIAFFDNTFDRNQNGAFDDPLTHVAVVLSVDSLGTILMAHGGSSRGRSTFSMNLSAPDVRRTDEGRTLNDYLRPHLPSDPPNTQYLSSQLFRGFATVYPDQVAAWEAEY